MSVKSQFGDIEVPEDSLHQFMFKAFARYGKINCNDGRNDAEYTYNDIINISRRIASGLAKLGVNKGDVVAIYSYNTPEWVLMFWGIVCAGATATTLNHAYTKYEIEHQLKDSGAKLVYTEIDLLPNCKEAGTKLPYLKKIIVSGSPSPDKGQISFNSLTNDDGSYWNRLEILTYDVSNDVVAIPYSSGTTGLPKGVMLTHYNIVANCLQTGHKTMVDPAHERNMAKGLQTVLMGIMPFYHVYGLVFAMCKRMAMGDKVVVMPRFEPRSFLRAIEKHKVTFLSLVPPIVNFIAKTPLLKEYDLSSVTSLGNAAAPLSKYMEQAFTQRMHINELKQGFRLTETTCSVCSYSYTTPYRPKSCGKLIPSTEAMIVDTTSGKVLGTDEVGEMWFRGPQIMKGYLNKPEATRQTVDVDGWLHTGDIGYYDSDHYFYVVDRIKELIKVKGFQVAPAELEALLLGHPAISDCGVVGISDKRAGEIPRAYVVKKLGVSATEKELCDYVAERTAPFKHLKGGVQFISHIPRLPSGKILRRKLKENASNL